MNIQINGFDIEILTEDGNLSLKVTDASGKELSNNTFTQEQEGQDEVKPATVPSAEEVADNTEPKDEDTDESLIPTLESIKKSK